MKWTDKNSIMLTRISIYLFVTIALVSIVFAKTITQDILFVNGFVRTMQVGDENTFILCLRIGLVIALPILLVLHKLVMELSKDEVFTKQNIKLLRILSWLCMLECVACVCFSLNYITWLLVAAVMGFIALIIRVIKNVFCHAFLIKQENDYTI